MPPQEAPNIWPHIEPYIQAASNYGGGKFAVHHWLAKVLSSVADLFVSADLKCTLVCEPQAFPLRNVYVIVLLGGEGGHPWDSFNTIMDEAAKKRGCDCIEVYGRPGWRTILKEHDYQLAHHVWRKEIE